jgi:hypothetical protein
MPRQTDWIGNVPAQGDRAGKARHNREYPHNISILNVGI